MGLSITKAYVEALEGQIWVESNSDDEGVRGSVFYFTLPPNDEYRPNAAEKQFREA